MFCNFLFSQSDPVPIFGGAGIEERNAELQGCLGNKEARKIIFPAKPPTLQPPSPPTPLIALSTLRTFLRSWILLWKNIQLLRPPLC